MSTKFILTSLCASLLSVALATAQDIARAKPQTETPKPPLENVQAGSPESIVLRGHTNTSPSPKQPGNRDVDVHWTLGIEAEPVPQWLMMHLPQFFRDAGPQAASSGLLVTKVAPKSPAAQAQLEPGDLILSVDDVRVAAPIDMQVPLRKAAGQPVTLSMVRRGNLFSSQIQAQGTPLPPARTMTNVLGATAINLATFQGTLSITGNNDSFHLSGSYVDVTGVRVPLNTSGSLNDILAELQHLPEPLRTMAKSRMPNLPHSAKVELQTHTP